MLHSLQNSQNLTPQQQNILQHLTHQYKMMHQHQQLNRMQQQQPQQLRVRAVVPQNSTDAAGMIATPNFSSVNPLVNHQIDSSNQKQFKSTDNNFNMECQDISKS
jgi:hypothetical protein